MEQRRRSDEDNQDARTDDSSEKSRERRLFGIGQTLEAWLQRRSLGEQEAPYEESEAEEDDDDDTESERKTKEKTRKFRRLLRSFFGGQVERDPIPIETPAVQTVEQQPTPVMAIPEQPFDPMVAVSYEAQVSTPQEQEQTTDTEPTEAVESPVAPAQEREIAPEEVPTEPVFIEATPAPVAPINEVEVPLGPRDNSGSLPRDREAPAKIERNTAQERDLKKLEKKERRHNRRDKREVRELKERTVKLEKSQEDTIKRMKKTEVAKKPEVSAPSVKTPEVVTVQPERKSKEEISVVDRPAESIKEILEKRKIPQSPESLARSDYESLRPETVQQQVEKAAEQDVAIEGMFERRHETKDADAQQQQHVTAVGSSASAPPLYPPIGSVSSPLTAPAPQQGVNPQLPPLLSTNSQPTKQDYQRAARNGVMAALILLLFIALMAFLR